MGNEAVSGAGNRKHRRLRKNVTDLHSLFAVVTVVGVAMVMVRLLSLKKNSDTIL